MIKVNITQNQMQEAYDKFLLMYNKASKCTTFSNEAVLNYGRQLLKQLNKNYPNELTKITAVKSKCEILNYIS
jgi:hypothetical protein